MLSRFIVTVPNVVGRVVVCLSCYGVLSLPAVGADANPPNFVILLTDDQSPTGRHSSEKCAEAGSPIIAAFHRMTGDVSQIYGLANVDALSVKRQRTLPVNCTVYDLYS